jgi:hypothetical protein
MRALTILLVLACIYGCGTLGAIDRLKELSATRDEQQECIEKQEEKFKQLLKDFSEGEIEKGTSEDKIVETYGEPITTKRIKEGSLFKEELMYRHPAQFFGSEKIFLYFDNNKELIDTEYKKQSSSK